MGRAQPYSLPNIASGIEIRPGKKGPVLRIHFRYRGVECRETLKLEPSAANLKYVQRLRGEILNAIDRGTFNYSDYFPDSKRAKKFGYVSSQVTIEELLRQFLVQTKHTLQPITFLTYEKVCKAHLFKTFGAIRVKELTPAYIREWIGSLSLTAKTTRQILIPLRAVLDQAVNDDLIERNPLDRVKLTKLLNKQTLKSDYQADPFDRNEINAILAHSQAQLHSLFQFAFFTGLRSSELIALEWQDIDWINGLIAVRRAVVAYQEKTTKTEAGLRDVLLLPPALEALQAQKTFTFLEGKRIFHNPFTQAAWNSSDQIRDPWRTVLKRAGVRYRNPYQMRHTYASMMLSAGENMLWLAKQMGHRDTEMIIRTYGKWIPDSTSRAGYVPVNNWGTVIQATATL